MRRPRPNIQQPAIIPAPLGGLNTTDSLMAMPPTDAVKLVNMVIGANGLRPRNGYQEHCTGIGAPILSMMQYEAANPVNNKMFAATANDIFDVSASSGAPGSVVNFPSAGGLGESIIAVTGADRYLLYCDEQNGYYTRAESSGTWTKVTLGGGAAQVSGVDPATFVQPCEFKGRIWFVVKGTTKAAYLAPNAVYGAATAYDFGSQFKRGGALAALYSWTRDGGAGMDDMLVAISTAGEIVIYQGTDPSTYGAWDRKGRYYAGPVPAGRRLAADYGGDLLINTAAGALPLVTLMTGGPLTADSYASRKVRKLFASYMADRRLNDGWSMLPVGQDNLILVTVPKLASEDYFQLVLSMDRASWSTFESLPVSCGTTWQGVFYFGTPDGRVCKYTGDADNVGRTGDTSAALEVKALVIPAFNDGGSAERKQIQYVRPLFQSYGLLPRYAVEARWDFDLSDITPPVAGPGGNTNVWDTATWDAAVFQGDTVVVGDPVGVIGMGTHFSLGLACASRQRVEFIGFHVAFEVGGIL